MCMLTCLPLGPLKRPTDTTTNLVKDKYGETFGFYHDVPEILHRLRDARVVVAAASRTSAPRLYVLCNESV